MKRMTCPEKKESHIDFNLLEEALLCPGYNILPALQQLVSKHAIPCEQCENLNEYGDSPVYVATRHGSYQMVKWLLQQGFRPDKQSSDGDFALWHASCRDRLDLAELLLEAGAEVNMQMSRNSRAGPNYHGRGGTILEVAISTNNMDLAELALEYNIDLNICDLTRRSPLFNSIVKNNIGIVSLLLEQPNCIVNESGSHKPCPLVAAVGTSSFQIVEALLARGAQPNCFGDDVRGENHTPLTKACQMGYIDTTNLLLDYGGDPNFQYTQNRDYMYPLHHAIKYPYQYTTGLDLVRCLVDKGADVNQLNQYGESPVFMAVYLSSMYVLVHLIQAGAKVGAVKGSQKRSPLELAIDFGYLKIATLLANCMVYFKPQLLNNLKESSATLSSDGEFGNMLRERVRNCSSLQAMCREVIRDELQSKHVSKKIDLLPLPVCLKKYLKFENLRPY